MIEGKSVLALIPARGGSKGVPRKNICDLGGKPLIAWSIEAARKSRFIDRVVLSSEDAEIIAVAKKLGCEVPFVRPAELSRDDTPGVAPVLHALEALPGYDYLVLLQPTSPLRSAADIDACIEMCLAKKAPVCVSVTESAKSPYWMFVHDSQGRFRKLIDTGASAQRRQELPKAYVLNGAVYVAESRWLAEHKTFVSDDMLAYEMPRWRSVDIDEAIDIDFAETILARNFSDDDHDA